MKHLKLIVVFIAILALALTACTAPAAPAGESGGETAPAECTDAIGCVEVAADEPIRVGYMLTISGPTAFLGDDSRGGIEIALANKGQVHGHDIELVGEDSLCSAEGGQTAAQKVASDPTITGIIGTTCSSSGSAALPIISQAGMLMISPSNTAPVLTDDNTEAGGIWQPGYYRTGHNDLFQGRIAAEFAVNELGATKLATIHDGSPYADGLQTVMSDVFAELGQEVVFQGAVNVGDTDMRPILTEVAVNPPDVLYFPIFEPEGNLIAAQAKEIPGLENMVLMGADGLYVDAFPENTGPASVGMYLSSSYIAEGGAYDEFLATWEEQLGGSPPSAYHAHAYDGANILLNAIEEVAQVNDDGSLLIGRQALRDAVSATSGHEGLTGVLSCSPTGDCATGEALAIFEITEEELNGNWPPPMVWQP